MSDTTWLVLGLGNPGAEYEQTRHSIGHDVVARLADGTPFKAARRTPAVVIEGRLGIPPRTARTVLARSTGFMNTSGGPASGLVRFYDVTPDHLIVVHDDLDLDHGVLKVKQGGGDGGHNGLKDITKALGTNDYLRVRFGVGRPPGRQEPADYVLSRFSGAQRQTLPDLITDAAEAVELIVLEGLDEAQRRINGKARA